MTVPILIAWAAPSLVDIDGVGEYAYAHLFEIVAGASGFTAGQTYHGMIACPCEVLSPLDGSEELIDFKIHPKAQPRLYALGDTSPEDLQQWEDQIMTAYGEQAGSVYETADG
jgi:hypothetical protein